MELGIRDRVGSAICSTALASCVLAPWAGAGTGTMRLTDDGYVLDFCVSVRFNASPAQMADIEGVFDRASEVVADATDGQLRFGDVAIFENSMASTEAEVWIHPGSGQAVATYGQYGVRGEYITSYNSSNYAYSNQAGLDGNAYTIAHEFMHHLWSILDEYQGASCQQVMDGLCSFGVSCNAGPSDCEPSPGSVNATFCLLDNYFLRGGNLNNPAQDDYTLDELCVASNHDPDIDTGQHCVNGESCWETIASHPLRPLVPPGGLPTNAAPGAPPVGFPTLVPASRFVLAIDRSGSMDTADAGFGETRLLRAQQAAEIFANLTEVDDWLGVTSFSCSTSADFPMVEVTGNATKTNAATAAFGLTAGGKTAIGSGLQRARDEILMEPDACNPNAILVTDGFGNCGPSELGVIDSLVENGIATTTVAIGAEPQQANLIEIAQRTGGRFYWVETAEDLPGLSAVLYADVSGKGLISVADGDVPTAQTIVSDAKVDSGNQEITFVMSWTNLGVEYDLGLVSPTGVFHDKNTAAGDPNVEFLEGTGHEIARIRKASAEAGDWQVLATPLGGGATSYRIAAITDALRTSLAASTERVHHQVGEPIHVRATPRFTGRPVGMAGLSATVRRPDGTKVGIVLHDDGNPLARDMQADDGTYSAVFADTSLPGAYTFEVHAAAANGQTLPGEVIFAKQGEPAHILMVPEFRRYAVASAVVGSAPCGFLRYGETTSPVHQLDLDGFGGTSPGSVAIVRTTGAHAPIVLSGMSLAADDAPFAGGSLLISLPLLFQTAALPILGGNADWVLPIPFDKGLVGLSLYFQSLASSSQFPGGFELSNGLRLVICPSSAQ